MLSASVVGATGYTGGELLRILATHGEFEVVAATSRSDAGTPVTDVWPGLRGLIDLRFYRSCDRSIGGVRRRVPGDPERNGNENGAKFAGGRGARCRPVG